MLNKIKFIVAVLVLAAFFGAAAEVRAQSNCGVLDDFNRADSTNMGANWTETPGGSDLAISNNRAVRVVNNSAMSFNGSTPSDRVCADVYSGGSALQFGGLYIKYAGFQDNLFVKVQDNDNNGDYDRIFFSRDTGFTYNSACSNFAISSPFTSARLTVYLDGTTLKADIDTNFDNIADQNYSCGGVPTRNGTSVGLGIFGPTQMDNFGIPPTTLTVTKTADTNDGVCDADCSLREAIAAANSGDSIVFAAPLFDNTVTLTLTLGELSIGAGKNLTITGRNAARTIINGNNLSRAFNIASGATVNINSLTIRRGSADNGGGIYNAGNVTLTNCAVENNQVTGIGGGLYNVGGTLTVSNSTVSGNTAGLGGGIANGGNPSVLNVTNSTISGNTTSGLGGGGIFASGAMTIRSSTVSENNAVGDGINSGIGGGIANYTIEAVTLGNTIVAGNTAATAPDFRDTLTSLGNNLIGNTSGTFIQGTTTGNILNQNAQLMPFNFYGGFTQTHALLPESPAVNAGTATGAPATDQRGRARVGQTDIGAFELPSSIVVTNTLDSGAGSLRAAILAANSTANDELILFSILPGDAGCVSSVCTITLTSGTLNPGTEAAAGAFFISNSTGAARLRISGNNASSVFISNSGVLALNGLTLTNGNASSGGGINSSGTALTVFSSTISNNAAPSFSGGGLNLCVSGVIANSSITGNTARDGGAIAILSSNTCGIYENRTRIINSTISGNSATNTSFTAGGILASGAVTIISTTITNNTAPSGTASAGGIRNNGSTIRLLNSLVAGNTSSSPDINGTVTSLGYNLIGDTNGTTINGTTTGNILNQSALLAPLGFYGGSTPTHALLSNSPAINAGTATGATTTDQRGAARIGNPDMGAFELSNSANGGNFVAQLPGGTQNVQYSYTLIPETGATAYCISAGNLPSGLSGIDPCQGLFADNNPAKQANLSPSAALTISGIPLQNGTFNFSLRATNGGNTNVTDFVLNILGPTAANVSVSGRVLTDTGRGLRNAIVTMTDANGIIRTARTSSFGYYHFDDIAAGHTVIVAVRSKQFQFAPQVVNVRESLTNVNFTALQ
jgi:CSLREA domain-containing protein